MTLDNPMVTGPMAAQPKRVCVVGAGYVGLTAAACLAELGHVVSCVESSPARLGQLLRGRVPIKEPGLDDLVARHRATGHLSFTADMAQAVAGASVALLCVGTPPRADGDPDLSQLANAAIQIAGAAKSDVVLVVKSTVPPGSCEALELAARGRARPGVTVSVASNPEFLRESQAVWDFFNPDRVVVGVDAPDLEEVVTGLYPSDWPLLVCDRRSAELVKYAANTFLAIKISFANEVAALCEGLGADAGRVLAGVGLDARIGGSFLNPGAGFGGSCLPKDLSGFIAVAASVGQEAAVARAAQQVNEEALHSLVAKLEAALGGLAGRRIGLLGLAFKPGTDDLRASPAVALARLLARRGASVVAHDPMAVIDEADVIQVTDPFEAIDDADAVVVATAWPSYRELDAGRLRDAMRGHVVLDAAGAVDARELEAAGLEVYGVGHGRPLDLHPVVWRPLEWMHPGEPLAA